MQLSDDPERRVVQEHLSSADAPVYYVETSFSLFGLLCWDASVLPVRGAFFHPFQSGPAEPGCPDLVARRRSSFDACLRRLDTGEHSGIILRTFAEKVGCQGAVCACLR